MHTTDPKTIADVIRLVLETDARDGTTMRRKHMEIAARCGADPRALLLFFREAARILERTGNEAFAREMRFAHNRLADDLEARFATEEWRAREFYWGQR